MDDGYRRQDNYRAIIGGCFYFGESMEREAKAIYCPQCKRKCGRPDGKSQINKEMRCRKCNKLIVYDIATDTVSVKKIPERICGSGVRFW